MIDQHIKITEYAGGFRVIDIDGCRIHSVTAIEPSHIVPATPFELVIRIRPRRVEYVRVDDPMPADPEPCHRGPVEPMPGVEGVRDAAFGPLIRDADGKLHVSGWASGKDAR